MKKLLLSVMLGHAVADALGVPVQFRSRLERDRDPVTTMTGYGTYPFPAGCWSDDTSMSLCALDVLANGKMDLDRIMYNFALWYYKGEFTPTGETFDVGTTCSHAIENYVTHKKSVSECGINRTDANGNGSLMRIHPFVLYAISRGINEDTSAFLQLLHTASSLTHAHKRSLIGCGIYGCVLSAIVKNPCKEAVLDGLKRAREAYSSERELAFYQRLFEKDFDKIPRSRINSSGYVVDTLEAAIWCLLTTNSYKDCVLTAVNLGSDTDTVGAVAGGLAGVLYGVEGIPAEWLEVLRNKSIFEETCNRAAQNWSIA